MPVFPAVISALTAGAASVGATTVGGGSDEAGLDGAFADLLAMLTATLNSSPPATTASLPGQATSAALPATASPPAATRGESGDRPALPGLDRLTAILDQAFAMLTQGEDPDAAITSDLSAAIDAIAALVVPPPTDPTIVAASGEIAADDAQVVVQRLAQLTDRLSEMLAPLNPDLGQKLKVLSEVLQSGASLGDAVEKLMPLSAGDTSVPPGFAQMLSSSTRATNQAPTIPSSRLDLPPDPAASSATPVSTERPVPQPAEDSAPSSDPPPKAGDGPRLERASHVAGEGAAPSPLLAAKVADNAAPPDPTSPPAAPPLPRVEASAAAVPAAHLRPYTTPPAQLDMPQLAFEIVRQAQGGTSRFEIRLDPPELGRIDVRLDIDKGGSVHARMTVDQTETLDLLQRDQRALERAMVQAGLDPAKTSLEFSLRQNPFSPDGGSRQGGQHFQLASTSGSSDEPDVPVVSLYRGTASPGGLNLYV